MDLKKENFQLKPQTSKYEHFHVYIYIFLCIKRCLSKTASI